LVSKTFYVSSKYFKSLLELQAKIALSNEWLKLTLQIILFLISFNKILMNIHYEILMNILNTHMTSCSMPKPINLPMIAPTAIQGMNKPDGT
jgi:hypothetical protein